MTIEEKLIFASETIKNVYPVNFNKLYPFTTENLKGYMSKFDFKEKSVLTVGSSSDQIFNSHFYGARDIVCFDINPLTKDYFYLKKAAIKALSYEEFVNCFSLYVSRFYGFNKYAFNEQTMNKILNYLNGESLYFWLRITDKYSFKRVRKSLFTIDEYNIDVVKSINSYLSEENYYLLKSRIDELNPEFIVSDIRDVSSLLNKKFDYIMLSNLASFISRIYGNSLEKFKDNILSLSDFLNNDGVLFFAYLYDFDSKTVVKDNWDVIYHLDKVIKVFEEFNLGFESIEGMKSIINKKQNSKDLVLTFRK